jgi:hypothetical protein
MSMRWKWEACTTSKPLLNLCCLNLLVLKCKNTHIKQMQVLMVVILRLRIDIRRMVMSNPSNMAMDTTVLVLHREATRLALTHHLATTLLLLVHRVLRGSLLVVRGGTFESDSSCSFPVSKYIALVFCFLLFGDTHMMREGQIAGSACSSSILCFVYNIRIRLQMLFPIAVSTSPESIPVSLPLNRAVLPSSQIKDVFPFVRLVFNGLRAEERICAGNATVDMFLKFH